MFSGMFSQENWNTLFAQLVSKFGYRYNLSITDSWFSNLSARYDHGWRKFHNQTYVGDLLQKLNGRARSIMEDPLSLKMATWFHASVFVPGKTDNEQSSMRLFHVFASEIDLPLTFSSSTSNLILAPRTTTERTVDETLFTDLLNLYYGDTWERFCEAQGQISDEQHLYCGSSDDSIHQIQNIAKLRNLLEQGQIFQNEVYQRYHEIQARNNINRWLKTASP